MAVSPSFPAHSERATRFDIRAPLEYRASGCENWCQGTTVNISRSGVLFSTQDKLEVKTLLEMRIVFPAEITGGHPANVLCWGPVVRVENSAAAAAILKYRFVHE